MRYLLLVLLVVTGGCGSDSDRGGSAFNEQLTVEFVNSDLHQDGYATTGTALVHDDGLQGDSYDFGRVVVSRVSWTEAATPLESLAYAYRLNHPAALNQSHIVAFYIDTDGEVSTGQLIEGIGADHVLYNGSLFESNWFNSDYAIWSEANSTWEGQPISGSSSSALYKGSTSSIVINVPAFVGISELFGLTDAKGVLTVRTLVNDDANDPNSQTLGASSPFTFSTP